jgi:LysR family transcriptional regulator for bpeEF and oprC
MDRLRWISTFLSAADAENFSQAAQALQVSPQAVSAQVSQLEAWLGVRLFHRTTRRMSLTDDGRLYLEYCRGGMHLIEQGERDLRDRRDEVAGKLRVVASPSLGQILVAPLVASFCAIHPGLQVELLTQSHFPDLVDSSIDLGVIGGELPSSSLVARRAGRFTHLLCASPAYLQTHGTPSSPTELTQHRCVGLRHPRTGRVWPWAFQQGGRVVTLEPPLAALTQDPSVQRQLVLHGAGIAQIADYFARPLLLDGTLVELPLNYQGPKIDVHVFLPRRTQVPRRTRLLSDYLWDGLRQALSG